MKKKRFIFCCALVICCIFGGAANAKNVYYETFNDGKTGRQIEYFDLYEDTTRNYFTQNAWFSDNKSFIVCGESDGTIYKYDTLTKSVDEVFGAGCLPLDNAAVVGPDDTVYARNKTSNDIYMQKPLSGEEEFEPLSMTLPLASGYESNTASTSNSETATSQQYSDGSGLTFGFYTNDRWNEGMTLARQKGGKWCRTTIARNTGSGLGWYEIYNWDSSIKPNLRSTFMSFKVDNSKISADTRNVTIEFDYFDNNDSAMSGQYVELTYLATDSQKKTVRVAYTQTGEWKTARFDLTDAQFDHRTGGLQGGYTYDFRIGSGGNRGGFASSWIKVYPTESGGTINLGHHEPGGWHPHVSINGDLSLTTGDKQKIVIYEANNKRFASTDVWIKSTHAMINPVYPNLVLYSDDSADSDKTFARIRLFNRNTMFKGGIFSQYSNLSGGVTTGEAVGHESWTPDGEHIVAVKYEKESNIGRDGIIRMDKNGGNREYINGDYNYWHCAAATDGRWIVADTVPVNNMTNIVLIDAKTGKSHLVARQRAFSDDPGQPHPSFNLDGSKVTFAIARRKLNSSDESYVMGVAVVDVSDIVNDGQIAEPAAPTDFRVSPFEVGFNEDSGKNEVTATIDNIDGRARAMNLYAAVYDAEGKLISVNKERYNSASDGTLTADIAEVKDGKTVKFFLWDDDTKPVENSVGTIKLLRAAKVGANEIVLSWQDESDMPIIKYEVYRGNQKIGETTDTVFRDSGLSKTTEYTYYVRPIYNSFSIGEDGAAVSADVDDLNLDGIYSIPGNPSKNRGLTFFENNNLALDSYTEYKVIDGEGCRKARQVQQGETDAQGNKRWGSTYNGNFYFKCDRDAVTADTNNVLIGVRYYDNRSGINLGVDYKASDGTVKNKTVVTKTGTNTWKTATIVLNDAKFIDGSELSGYDFRFQGGYDMYISRTWVIPLDGSGNRISVNNSLGSPTAGERAGVKVKTRGETISALMAGNNIIEEGLRFVLNGDSSTDGYTEPTSASDKDCRQNSSASTSMFCFKVDKDIIPEDVTAVDVTVEYYGYNYNGGKIQLQYTATNGTTKTVDVASLSSWSNKQWKTATVSLTDAKFISGLSRNSDFIIKPTAKSTKIRSVTVTKKSTPAASAHQYVEWTTSTDASSGLSRISGGQISGDCVYVNSANDWLKFSVDDVYLYGKSNNMAWIDITYRDETEGNHIYLYYNTSDPTATAPKADKQAETVITLEGTGKFKTVRIPLIDACFSNYDGYDFRIGTDNGAYINKIKVLGY